MKTESTNSIETAPAVHKSVTRKSMAKQLIKGAVAALFIWVFVFTVVWSYVTDLGIHWIYDIATSMDSDPPDFRVYVKQSKVLGGLCDASNWVADITRPLVADEVLVKLWEAKHVQWEELVRHAKPGDNDIEKTDPELAKSARVKGIWMVDPMTMPEGMRNDPRHFENSLDIDLVEDIGRVGSGRACKGKGGYVTKRIAYFYYFQPPIVYKNRVIRRSDFDYYKEATGKGHWASVPGIKLVASTDLEADEYEVARKLNYRWFIVHKTLND